MDRRQFLKGILGGIGAAVLAPIIPLVPSPEVGAALIRVNPGNHLLTIDAITREALKILHDKLVFTTMINRQYDRNFKSRGSVLKIRMPNEYRVRQGA